MLSLHDDVDRRPLRGSRAVGDDDDLGGAGERGRNADNAAHFPLGDRDPLAAGADDHVDFRDALGPVRHRRDRLRAADPVDLVDLGDRRGSEDLDRRLTVGPRGGAADDRADPGDLRRDRGHEHARGVLRAATRRVDAGPLDGEQQVLDAHPNPVRSAARSSARWRWKAAIASRASSRAARSSVRDLSRAALRGRRRIDSQLVEVDAVEARRVLANGLVSVLAHRGEDGADLFDRRPSSPSRPGQLERLAAPVAPQIEGRQHRAERSERSTAERTANGSGLARAGSDRPQWAMPADRSELSSIASLLEQLTKRVSTMAETGRRRERTRRSRTSCSRSSARSPARTGASAASSVRRAP